MDASALQQYIENTWQNEIVPTLHDYIRIPNKSPLFDAQWQTNGYMEQAVTMLSDWAYAHAPKNMQLHVLRLNNRTPLILMEIPGDVEQTVLMYGHLDKQPEMTGWADGMGPWVPVLKGDRLYGRGGADDGYAMFAALTAINALQQQKIPHPRCVILIEACEESGSYDLPHYLDTYQTLIGSPNLVICLDSGCGNYQQLWITTSLRGNCVGELRVDVLTEGVHSGNAGGIVPDSMRILRHLLDRIEDPETGDIYLTESLDITAQSQDGEIMAIQHKKHAVFGVQFHPESLLTQQGYDLLNNFIEIF